MCVAVFSFLAWWRLERLSFAHGGKEATLPSSVPVHPGRIASLAQTTTREKNKRDVAKGCISFTPTTSSARTLPLLFPAFSTPPNRQQDLAVDDLVKLVPGHSPHFEEVLRGCLQTKPEDRLSPMELLELEWFRRFREPQTALPDGEDAEKSPNHIAEGELGGEEAAAAVEEHSDLDQAVRVVREYIERAVECGVLAGGFASGGPPCVGLVSGGAPQGGDRRGSSGSGMIQTMRRWDLDASFVHVVLYAVPGIPREDLGATCGGFLFCCQGSVFACRRECHFVLRKRPKYWFPRSGDRILRRGMVDLALCQRRRETGK